MSGELEITPSIICMSTSPPASLAGEFLTLADGLMCISPMAGCAPTPPTVGLSSPASVELADPRIGGPSKGSLSRSSSTLDRLARWYLIASIMSCFCQPTHKVKKCTISMMWNQEK